MRHRRLITTLAAAAALIALIAVAAVLWPSSAPEAMVSAETPTTFPTAVDAIPIMRAEVVEIEVPGNDGEVLYAHLLPDGIPQEIGSVNGVVIAETKDLPEFSLESPESFSFESVVASATFGGRLSAPTHMKVHPTTGMGVIITPAEIDEIEVDDNGTIHRAEAIDIGQGYRVFIVPDLTPRPWTDDGPPVRPVR